MRPRLFVILKSFVVAFVAMMRALPSLHRAGNAILRKRAGEKRYRLSREAERLDRLRNPDRYLANSGP